MQRQVEPLAVPAHPADLPRRHADHQREVRHVACHHRAGADEGMTPDRRAAHDGAVGAKRRAAAHERRLVLVLARDRGARIEDVGEHHAWAAEHVVLERDRVVDTDVVLDAHVVADDGVAADVDVLAERAVAADPRARADVDQVPDARAFADLRAVIHDGGGVRAIRHVGLQDAARRVRLRKNG